MRGPQGSSPPWDETFEIRVWEEMVKVAGLKIEPDLTHALLLLEKVVWLHKSLVSRLNTLARQSQA